MCQKWDFHLGIEQESQTPTTHPNPKNSYLWCVFFFLNLKRYIIDTLPTKNFPIGAKGLFAVSFREGNHLLYKQTFNHQALQAPAVPRLSFDPVAIGFFWANCPSCHGGKKSSPPQKKTKKNTCHPQKESQKGFLPGAPPPPKKKNVTVAECC